MVDMDCAINLNLRVFAFQELVTQVSIVLFRANRVFGYAF